MQQARRWLGDLPPAAARRIAWENGASPVRPAGALTSHAGPGFRRDVVSSGNQRPDAGLDPLAASSSTAFCTAL